MRGSAYLSSEGCIFVVREYQVYARIFVDRCGVLIVPFGKNASSRRVVLTVLLRRLSMADSIGIGF